MNLFNVCTNVVVVGKINRSSSSSSNSIRTYGDERIVITRRVPVEREIISVYDVFEN